MGMTTAFKTASGCAIVSYSIFNECMLAGGALGHRFTSLTPGTPLWLTTPYQPLNTVQTIHNCIRRHLRIVATTLPCPYIRQAGGIRFETSVYQL
jgi:hypothetical protein